MSKQKNVSRWLPLLAGGALLGYGLTKRRNAAGLASSVVGSALMFKGFTHTDEGAAEESAAELEGSAFSQRTVTVLAEPRELFNFWRDAANFPRFMQHVISVKETAPDLQHWVMKTPLGEWEWDSKIIDVQPGRLIAWRTLPGASLPHSGSVEFTSRDDGRGTEVRMTMHYDFPAGKAGEAMATVIGRSPEQSIRENLRRFKQLYETGEIATTLGQPAGKRGMKGSFMENMMGELTRQSA